MYNKKMWALLLTLLMICVVAGCDSKNPSKVEGSQINKPEWLLKHLGFDNVDIQQIQVTTDGKILVSSAGKIHLLQGENFEEIDPPESVSIFYVMEKGNTQTIFAGSSSGTLYMKNIQEKEWQKTNLATYSQPINTIAGDHNNGYIYVGQASKLGGGIWKSIDNGITWTKLTDITARSVVVHPHNSDTLYAVDRVTNFSNDQGKTWNKINSAANYGVLIHPLSAKKAYIAFSQGVVIAEHNGTIKSVQRFNLPGAMTCLELNFARLDEWAVGNWDYPSGKGGLYLSFDSGDNWVMIEDNLNNTRITDMRFDKEGNMLYIGTAGKGLWALNLAKIRDQSVN